MGVKLYAFDDRWARRGFERVDEFGMANSLPCWSIADDQRRLSGVFWDAVLCTSSTLTNLMIWCRYHEVFTTNLNSFIDAKLRNFPPIIMGGH